MPAARYWRLEGIDTYDRVSGLSLTEVGWYVGATRVDTSATIIAPSPATGSLTNLSDGSTGTSVLWDMSALFGAFRIDWDMGSPQDITKLTFKGTSAGAFVYAVEVWYSTDNVTWTKFSSHEGIAFSSEQIFDYSLIDPNFSSIKLLLRSDAPATAKLFGDDSPSKHTLTYSGVDPYNSFGKYGGSIYFNPAGTFNNNYINISSISDFVFPADFTVECWVYPLSMGATWGSFIFSTGDTGTNANGWHLVFGYGGAPSYNKTEFGINGIGSVYSDSVMAMNQWTHIAVVRQGSTIKMYINGVAQSSTVTSSATVPASSFFMGRAGNNAGTTGVSGYVDEACITKGVARYTADFTPSKIVDWDCGNTLVYRVATQVSRGNVGPIGESPSESFLCRPVVDRRLRSARGGFYRVKGTVKETNTPTNTPLSRKVQLYAEQLSAIVDEQWSNGTTGEYSFDYISNEFTYTVIAFDHLHNYRAVIADNLTPERMP